MLTRFIAYLRQRWHPLWRLRQSAVYRWFQQRLDPTVHWRLPQTGCRVALKLLRDASWIVDSAHREPEIRRAFDLVLELLQPRTFWDVGANIGFYAWRVQRAPQIERVLLFEPDPTNFALLSRTLRLNGLTKCHAFPVALSDRVGAATFLLDPISGATGALATVARPDAPYSLHHSYRLNQTIPCETTTMDALIAAGEPAPDFLKIDVEGAEALVLAGATHLLAEGRPTLLIETASPAIIADLSARGFAPLQIDPENILFIPTHFAEALGKLRDHFPAVAAR